MKNNILFTGLSGAGKSYLLERVKQIDPSLDEINAGKEILLAAQEKSLVNTSSIDLAFERIKQRLSTPLGSVALNTYCIYGDNTQSIKSNYDRLIDLPLTKSIVIESDPEYIQYRRKKDSSFRNRSINSNDEIEILQTMSSNKAKEVSKYLNIPIMFIDNKDSNTVHNIKTIIDFINNKE